MNSVLSIRAYSDTGPLHSHDFVQVVLPMDGALEIEVGGRGACLSYCLSAFIAPGEMHTQAGLAINSSLILDAPISAFPPPVMEELSRKPFFKVSVGMQRLIEFAAQRIQVSALKPKDLSALSQLLTSAFGADFQHRTALDVIGDEIYRAPAADWSVNRIAHEIGVSRSVLYRRLSAEGKGSPGRFVARTRLKVACVALTDKRNSIAEIALRCGFSDQSALTRAMRRELGRTPAEWRGKTKTPGQ